LSGVDVEHGFAGSDGLGEFALVESSESGVE
jgi:hypothetical protein